PAGVGEGLVDANALREVGVPGGDGDAGAAFGVALGVGDVPVAETGLGERLAQLLVGGADLLEAEDVGPGLEDPVGRSPADGGTDAVDVGRDDTHADIVHDGAWPAVHRSDTRRARRR